MKRGLSSIDNNLYSILRNLFHPLVFAVLHGREADI